MKKTTEYSTITQQEYNQIILENSEDLLMYQLADFDSQTSQAGQMWCDMASSNLNPIRFLKQNYKAYTNANQLANHIMQMKIYNNIEADMKTLASIVTNTLYSKYNTMSKLMKQNKIIRVNQKGGYCYINSINDIKTPVDECNLNEMKRFIMNGEFNQKNITEKIVILENANNVSTTFMNEIIQKFGKNISTITNIKINPDVKEIISKAINNNLTVIAFESTAIDTNQINELKNIIQNITEKIKKYITVYAKVPRELQYLYNIKAKYVNIRFT